MQQKPYPFVILFGLLFFIASLMSNMASAQEVQCPGFLTSRLIVGELGRVLPGDANNVRSEPNRNSELIGQIPAGATFIVLEGPQCVDGLAWWKVDYGNQTGWTPEGSSDEYWLEPAGPLPTLTPTFTPTNTPTPLPTLTPTLTPTLSPTLVPTLTPTSQPALPTLIPMSFDNLANLYNAPIPSARQMISVDNIQQLRPLTILGAGSVREVLASPDGQKLAVRTALGIWIVNADGSNALGRLIEIPSINIVTMVFSPDGKYIAVAGVTKSQNQPAFQVWDVEQEQRIGSLPYFEPIHAVAWSPDGKQIAIKSINKIILYEPDFNRIAYTIEDYRTSESPYSPTGTGLVYSPNSAMLAIVSGSDAYVWNVSRREHQIKYSIQGAYLYDVAFSANNSQLITVGNGGPDATPGLIRIWDLSTNERVVSQQFPIIADKIFETSERDRYILVSRVGLYEWDNITRQVKEIRTFNEDFNVAVLPDRSDVLLLGFPDGSIQRYNIDTGDQETIIDYRNKISHVMIVYYPLSYSLSETGDKLVFINRDRLTASIWNTEKGEIIAQTNVMSNDIGAVWFMDDNYINILSEQVNGEITNMIHVAWDWQIGDHKIGQKPMISKASSDFTIDKEYEIQSMIYHAPIESMMVIPHSSIALVTTQTTFEAWDLVARMPLLRIELDEGRILKISENGTLIAISSPRGISLWGIPQ